MSPRTTEQAPRGCPEDGDLRALLDDAGAGSATARHVAGCARCTARVERLREDAGWARDALLAATPAVEPNVQGAWRTLSGRVARETNPYSSEEGREMEPKPALWNRGAFRAAAACLAVVAIMVAFTATPMRTLADGVLNRFRVEKFAVITIPMDLVQPFQSAVLENLDGMDPATLQQQFAGLGTFTTDLSQTSARQVGSIDEARGMYGDFDVPDSGTIPDGFGDPNVYVSDAGTATYVLNTAAAQDIVDQLGLPIYSLPDATTYPTLTFTLDAPAAVGLEYLDPAGNRIVVGQMESPTLNIPDGLNMNQLREEILLFPGLPTDLVAQLRAIDDWEHTLIIPIPEGADSHDVTVNGEPGLLITAAGNQGSAVLWQDGGILHLVAGQVDSDVVLDIANSLN